MTMFLAVPRLLIGLLPTLEAQIPDEVFAGLDTLLFGIGWFVPISALLPILIVSIAVDVFQLIMAVFVRLKSCLPMFGT
jgi:hypothetical protein